MRRQRLTKLEREALVACATEYLAGDAAERFNDGCAIHGEPQTDDQRHAVALARALSTAVVKIV